MIGAHVALIPTLKLWKFEQLKRNPSDAFDDKNPVGANQVRAFAELGGQIVFGTDVGYMTDYDPTEEYLFILCNAQVFLFVRY